MKQPTTKGAEMEERVVAEGTLFMGGIFRVVRDEEGEYCTEYAESGRAKRVVYASLAAAMTEFVEAVSREERWRVSEELGDPTLAPESR